MALKKKFLKSKPVCKVSFDFPTEAMPEAKSVEILGDFNNWEPLSMRKSRGKFTRTIDLPIENNYEFRYRINGETWENDWQADAYVPNGIDGDNSVVQL